MKLLLESAFGVSKKVPETKGRSGEEQAAERLSVVRATSMAEDAEEDVDSSVVRGRLHQTSESLPAHQLLQVLIANGPYPSCRPLNAVWPLRSSSR